MNLSAKFKLLISKITFGKPKTILLTPEKSRFGNHLYFFLHAYIERKKGNNFFIQYVENMDYWLKLFPEFREFIIYKQDIKKLDFKESVNYFYQIYGVDYTQANLNEFIEKFLLNKVILNQKEVPETVINIRRGDFYNPENIERFGFDQLEYLRKSLKILGKSNKDCLVVSDDIQWCKENIDFIKDYFDSINYVEEKNPFLHFKLISNAKKIIIPNSTFSYWAGYINEFMHKDAFIIAPSFGAKHVNNGLATQLSPNWKVIH